jgi:hypothetical protein
MYCARIAIKSEADVPKIRETHRHDAGGAVVQGHGPAGDQVIELTGKVR